MYKEYVNGARHRLHTRYTHVHTHPYTDTHVHTAYTRNTLIFLSFFFYTRTEAKLSLRATTEADTIPSSSGLGASEIPRGSNLYVYPRQCENALDSREIHFVASPQRGKLNSSESRRVPFSGNKEEKSGDVSRTERRKAEVQTTSSDPMLTTSRNKENGHISLSPVIPSASNVFRSHVLFFIISCLLAPPALSEGLRVPDSFFLREPPRPSHPLPALLSSRFLSLRHMCFLLSLYFFFILYNYSSKCLYSVLYSSM